MRGRPTTLSRRAAVWVCGVLGALGILGGWWLAQPAKPTAAPAPSQVVAPKVTPVAHASTQRPIPALDDLASPTWGLGQGVVCGLARDADSGAPIEGATITLSLSRVAGSGMPVPGANYPSVVTGPDGTWQLRGGLRGAKVNVTAGAPGYEPSRNRFVAAATCERRVALPMHAGGAVLSGVLYDGLGGTIPGGVLQVKRIAADDTPAFARAPVMVRSDEEGRYEISVHPGTQVVAVHADGYAKSSNTVQVDKGGATYDVHLLPAGRIEGVVVDAESKQPVSGAVVSLENAGDAYLAGTGGDAVSDPDGRFVLEGVAPGLHEVRGTAGTRATSDAVRISLNLGEVVEDVTLELAPQLYVRGRVVNEQGAPVSGAMTQAMGPAGMAVGEPSDSEGQYFLGPLKPGAYMLTATREHSIAPDLVASSVTLGSSPVEDHEIVLTSRATVRGRVDGGGPTTVVRVDVALSSSPAAAARQMGNTFLSVPCDDDGSFELRDVIPGPVTIAAEDTVLGKAHVEVRVSAGGLDDVQLALAMRAGVHVQVEDIDGRPAAGVELMLTQQGAAPRVRAGAVFTGETLRTDGDGRASTGTLSPGRFSLSASQGGAPLKIQSDQVVVLAAGWQDLRVVVDANRGGVDVRTVDENGAPKEGIVVSVKTGAGSMTSMTDDDGVAAFEAVGAMGTKVAVSLSDPLGGAAVQKVATVGERLDVLMPVGQRLVVDVTGFGRGFVEVDGVAGKQRRDYDEAQERTAFAGLVRGQYSIRVVGTEAYGSAVATLPDQESVRPESHRWAQVQGRVLHADGTPASGLPVIVKGAEGFSPDTEITSVTNVGGIVTDQEGRFQVQRCFPGSTVLSFAGEGVFYKGSPITLEEGEQRLLPDFLIPEPTS